MNSTDFKDKPPRIPEWIIKKLLIEREFNERSGDLDEVFYNMKKLKGVKRASLWYWMQSLAILPGFLGDNLYRSSIMLKNYLKIAGRNILRQKGFSFINISSLAIGLASCMLILLWVQDEIDYDRHHEKADNIYRVITENRNVDPYSHSYSVCTPLAPALKANYPEILNSARFRGGDKVLVKYGDIRNFELNGAFGDQTLLEIFTFEFISGEQSNALIDPFSIVITRDFADKYFDNDNPVGKVLNLKDKFNYTVTGVLENPPQNSMFAFDFVIPFENYSRFINQDLSSNWGWYSAFNAFVLVHENGDYREISRKIEGIQMANDQNSNNHIGLKPFKDSYLYGLNGEGAITGVITFSALAAFTLIIACINFMNLSTARSSRRSIEIGLRKVAGARKNHLILQFLGEAMLMSFIAAFLALILCFLLLPVYNDLSGKQLELDISRNIILFLSICGTAILTGIIAGSYPAFYLSSFQPVKILKTTIITRSGKSSSLLRRMLVITQFSISIILIISSMVVYRQLEYIRNKDLGFEKEHLLYVEMNDGIKEHYESIKNELLNNPGVLGVSKSSSIPGLWTNSAGDLDWEGKPDDVRGSMDFRSVGLDYFSTVGLEFIEGRPFSKEITTDMSQAFIINETALELLQMESPVVEKSFRMWQRRGKIIGVVKNVHTRSLHSDINPLFYTVWPYFDNYELIKINSGNISSTIDYIKDIHETLNPNYPFDYSFLDERIETRYNSEKKLGEIFKYFTILAILISCLGLFGLASFTAQRRTKEIGIRKALGSSSGNIVTLISKEFTVLVIISNIIAWPVSYVMMTKWLDDNFVYHTDIGIYLFIIAGIAAFTIALLSVSFQSIRAAMQNPVTSLRYE